MTVADPHTDLVAAAAQAFRRGFGAVLRLEPDEAPAILVDGRGATCAVRPAGADDPAADALWRASARTLADIFARSKALQNAYLAGRLAISGDMAVMARLDLEAAAPAPARKEF